MAQSQLKALRALQHHDKTLYSRQQHREDTEKHLSHSHLHFSRLTDAVIQSVVRMWSIILHYLLSGSQHVTTVC